MSCRPDVIYGTQPPITKRRTNQLRKKPLPVFMFPLNLIDCSINVADAAIVRKIIISDTSLKK